MELEAAKGNKYVSTGRREMRDRKKKYDMKFLKQRDKTEAWLFLETEIMKKKNDT